MPDVRRTNLPRIICWGCVFSFCVLFFPNNVQSATSNSATLQWAANVESDLAGYRIYHGTTPGVYGVPQTVGKTTTYQYANLESNKIHYFTITAYDMLGNESLPSPEVSKYTASSSSGAPPPSSLTNLNLTFASGQSYVVPASGLQVGSTVYRDRSYTFTTVPASLQGAAYIQTANTDKAATNAAFLSFHVNQPVTVYVAHDVRITPKPSWLTTFTNTGQNLVTSDTTLRLFARSFPGGTITLGGNASGGGSSMYSVIVQPKGGSDITPDTTTNVFWRNTSSGEVAVWLMNGLSITSVGFPGSASSDWKIEQVGDMNGDGKMDVLWRSTSGMVAVWLMNEATIITSGFLGGVPAEWVIKAIGDVNGDGRADVVWRNSNSGMVAIWFLNGQTITSVGYLGITPKSWDIEKVGDVNGDGKADLVWQNQTSGTVAVWLMNGLNFLSVGFPASTSTDWKIQSLGDMNGDGKMDVLWRNTSGMVAVWLMNGTTIASYNFVGGVPLEWEIKQVSDVNGDGKADVILQSQASGRVAVWMMNGLNVNSIGYPGSTPANWKIQR